MRALVTLTVWESKALIAKAVAKHPIVSRAWASNTVIVGLGTTNSYVLAELTGEEVDPRKFVAGIVCAEGPCVSSGVARIKGASYSNIFVKGVRQQVDLSEVVGKLTPDDLFIKGANALDPDGNVGVIVGHPELGHEATAKLWARTITQGLTIVVPVGLEKRIPGSIFDASNKVGIKTVQYSTGEHFALLIPHGANISVITEIEAIRLLTGAEATVVAAGGVNGAEGGLIFSINGSDEQIEKMIKLVDDVKGELPIEIPRGVCIATSGYTTCYASQCFWKGVRNSKRPAWKRRKELEVHEKK